LEPPPVLNTLILLRVETVMCRERQTLTFHKWAVEEQRIHSQFPVKNFLQFAQAPNYDALRGKLIEFIQKLGPNANVGMETVDTLLRIGTAKTWDPNVEQAVKSCLQWPAENIFPILDLLRIGVLAQPVAEEVNTSLNVCNTLATAFISPDNATNQMLMLKIICNVFGVLTNSLMENRSLIISRLLSHLGKGKQNHIAAATVFLNYSIVMSGNSKFSNQNQDWVNVESQTEILMTAVSLVDILEEPEAIYRLLTGIGNIIHKNDVMISLFKNFNGDTIAKNYAQNGTLPKIQVCARQISNSLAST